MVAEAQFANWPEACGCRCSCSFNWHQIYLLTYQKKNPLSLCLTALHPRTYIYHIIMYAYYIALDKFASKKMIGRNRQSSVACNRGPLPGAGEMYACGRNSNARRTLGSNVFFFSLFTLSRPAAQCFVSFVGWKWNTRKYPMVTLINHSILDLLQYEYMNFTIGGKYV